MNELTVSLRQIREMKHCIGYEKGRVKGAKNRKYTAWRNYFTTSGNDANWDNLVEQELAERREFKGGGENAKLYFVSAKGMKFLSDLLDVEILEDRR